LTLPREPTAERSSTRSSGPTANPRPGSSPTPGTTDEGFLALLNGEVDIALALREPNAPERLAARDQAPEDPPLTRRVRVLALDALVPVVSRDNPVASLAMSDLARIFSGRSTIGQTSAVPTRRSPCIFWPRSGPAQDFADRVLMATDRPLAPASSDTRAPPTSPGPWRGTPSRSASRPDPC
jgi:hypothetical protein